MWTGGEHPLDRLRPLIKPAVLWSKLKMGGRDTAEVRYFPHAPTRPPNAEYSRPVRDYLSHHRRSLNSAFDPPRSYRQKLSMGALIKAGPLKGALKLKPVLHKRMTSSRSNSPLLTGRKDVSLLSERVLSRQSSHSPQIPSQIPKCDSRITSSLSPLPTLSNLPHTPSFRLID